MSEKVNLRPDSFTEGGGLIDDVDAGIADVRFIMTDYEGALTDPVPVAKVAFDVDGEQSDQMYSVGGSGDFAPDDTGKGLIVLKSKSTLTKKSKFGMFLDSLVEAGFPLNKMDGEDISYLVGLNGHFLRKAVEFKGIKKKNDKESTVLVCTKINQLPWEADKKKKTTRKTTGSKAKAALADGALEGDVAGIIQGVLIDNDGSVAKKVLLSALFKNEAIKEMADKKAALKLAADDTFLKGRDEWSFADGVLTMA